MGTLTRDQPRLPEYCDHKLPTSCRLSSIPACCACADERAHSAAYSTYIDGIGFVSRGARWDRYCWFCKEYWKNRAEAHGLRPEQTRIPDVPDQREFLAKWYEFYQGYRVVKHEDGSDERVAVLGEDLREVSPGRLPRTLDELRAGRTQSELVAQGRSRDSHVQSQAQSEETGPSLEDTIDQMLQAAHREEQEAGEPGQSSSILADTQSAPDNSTLQQAMNPAISRNREYQTRRIAALHRQLQRMRSGVERVLSELRDIRGDDRDTNSSLHLDNIPFPSEQDVEAVIRTTSEALSTHTSQTNRQPLDTEARVVEARQRVDDAQRLRDQAASRLAVLERELRLARARHRRALNEQRTLENYTRVFGTREEMAAQGDAYESPIGGMFSRAWERFRVAEGVRREERNLRRVLGDEERIANNEYPQLIDFSTIRQAGRRRSSRASSTSDSNSVSSSDSPEDPHASRGEINTTPTSASRREFRDLTLRHAFSVLQGDHSVSENPVEIQDSMEEQDPSEAPFVAGPPGHQLDQDPYANNDRGLDALHMLRFMQVEQSRRPIFPQGGLTVDRMLRDLESNRLRRVDRDRIKSAVESPTLVWVIGLPAERNRRRRARGETVAFHEDAHEMALVEQETHHDVEIMAESFQMSGEVRRRSGLSISNQFHLLNRLQWGWREESDRRILIEMLRNDETFSIARDVHSAHGEELDPAASARHAQLERDRLAAAREGNHSRAELNHQRNATYALAAARLATGADAASPAAPHGLASQQMRTLNAMLTQQMGHLNEMHEANGRLQEQLQRYSSAPGSGPTTVEESNGARVSVRTVLARELTRQAQGYGGESATLNRRALARAMHNTAASLLGSSSSNFNESADNGVSGGLDATGTGRPDEPMADGAMTIKLECRVCYSQMATIATTPCGHLAMCQWCSDQHSPTSPHDRTRLLRPARCPICRKEIRQKFKIIPA